MNGIGLWIVEVKIPDIYDSEDLLPAVGLAALLLAFEEHVAAFLRVLRDNSLHRDVLDVALGLVHLLSVELDLLDLAQ